MRSGLKTRLTRIETHIATMTCSCILVREFHDADCLTAILKGMTRVCAVHCFRGVLYFRQVSGRFSTNEKEDRFCPCGPNTRIQFRFGNDSPGEYRLRTDELAPSRPSPTFHFQEYRIQSLVRSYAENHEDWLQTSSRKPSGLRIVLKEQLLRLLHSGTVRHEGQRVFATDPSIRCGVGRVFFCGASLTTLVCWPANEEESRFGRSSETSAEPLDRLPDEFVITSQSRGDRIG